MPTLLKSPPSVHSVLARESSTAEEAVADDVMSNITDHVIENPRTESTARAFCPFRRDVCFHVVVVSLSVTADGVGIDSTVPFCLLSLVACWNEQHGANRLVVACSLPLFSLTRTSVRLFS